MPSQRPSAAFDPIPPDLDLAALVEQTPNFEYVTRVSCDMIEAQSMEAFEKLVLLHVIIGGKPLVIEGFQNRLDEWTFTSQWLKDNCGHKFENARNLTKAQNLPLSIGHYLNNLPKLSNQWTTTNYKEPDRQRIYLKDIDCPQLWHDKLEEQVPPAIFYLNENTGDIGGPGAPDVVPCAKSSYTKGRGVARAGDLMSSLPPAMRADNMMCYIGHEGTYTPAHREMCASLGQNLMVETSGTVDEEGKPAKPGSSIWFMTESSDRHLVSEYWLSTLGHDIEVETHFAQINAWKAAPFTTYIVEQRVGDFILIPPLAPHQVWNRGTRTMKVAWNRTTVETLELAIHEALPRARMVCRDEQYKNKAIVYYTLHKYSEHLHRIDALKQVETDEQALMDLNYNTKIRQLQKDFKRLFALYTEILLSEMLAPVSPNEKRGQYLPYDSFVTCSYCRCNIFNRFLTCETCVEPLANGEENTYDICMECFAMGRSCSCISNFKWVEQFPWQELSEKYDHWRHQIIAFEGGINERSPRSLQRERKNLGKKPLAQVCQEQLKLRPWNDPNNPKPAMTNAQKNNLRFLREDEDDDQGQSPKSKTSKKIRADRLEPGFVMEHVSNYPRESWKCASCTKCDRAYQYGSLWRMFDIMPQTVMENPEWECPACLKICSCGSCRKKTGNRPYEPRGTVLGHDTKKVADVRSVESLVDFSHSNLHHIKKTGDDHPLESRRLGRRIDEAARARAKDPALDDNYVDEEELFLMNEQFYENGIRYTTRADIPIDPMLSAGQPSLPVHDIRRFDGNDAEESRRRHAAQSSDDQWWRRQSSGKTKAHPKPSGTAMNQPSSLESASVYESGLNLRPPTGNAPTVNMADPDDGFMEDGMTYDYAEPSVSQRHPSLSEPDFTRRQSSTSLVQGDYELNDDSNSRIGLAQTRQTLQEAKRKNRYIIAEAALSGKRMPVTLHVGRTGMALIADRIQDPSAQAAAKAPIINKELLQSDLPFTGPSDKPNGAPKKRKVRTQEDDEDFGVRKRRDRKGNVIQAVRKEQKKAVSYDKTDESSESDLPEVSFTTVNKPQGPRRLPKYLAEQHADGDTPAELPPEPPRRRSSHSGRQSLPPSHTKPNKRSSLAAKALQLLQDGKKSPEPAQTAAEANRRAKAKAVQWADGKDQISVSDASSLLSDQATTPSVTAKVDGRLLKVPESVFSRMAGKKIKIAGAKRKLVGVNGAPMLGSATKIKQRAVGGA
ncbi:MAG: hypothetical protein Q9217_003223 [Psora testacea]